MSARQASELLYDSEAALRLVDSAIEDIRESDPARDAALLAHGYTEIVSMLASVRGVRAGLDLATPDAMQAGRLSEASTALEQLETRLADLARTFDAGASRR